MTDFREERLRARAGEQGGLVTAAQCRDLGIRHTIVRARLRAGEWQQVGRGMYAIDAVALPPDPRLALRAALLALGPESVAVLVTAAALHGITGLPPIAGAPRPTAGAGPTTGAGLITGASRFAVAGAGPLPAGRLHVSRPRCSPRAHRPDVRVHHLTIPPEQIVTIDGIRATSLPRTVADLLRRLGRTDAVAVADSALNLGLLGADGVAEVDHLLTRGPGGARGRGRLQLADGRAASPLETRVRLACADGGVPPDALQYPVYDERGVLLGIGDMAWTRHRVIAEADGVGPHETPEALLRDRRRQNDLANAGWVVLRFTWADTYRPAYIATTVRQALARWPC